MMVTTQNANDEYAIICEYPKPSFSTSKELQNKIYHEKLHQLQNQDTSYNWISSFGGKPAISFSRSKISAGLPLAFT